MWERKTLSTVVAFIGEDVLMWLHLGCIMGELGHCHRLWEMDRHLQNPSACAQVIHIEATAKMLKRILFLAKQLSYNAGGWGHTNVAKGACLISFCRATSCNPDWWTLWPQKCPWVAFAPLKTLAWELFNLIDTDWNLLVLCSASPNSGHEDIFNGNVWSGVLLNWHSCLSKRPTIVLLAWCHDVCRSWSP